MAHFTETTFLKTWNAFIQKGYPLPELNAHEVRRSVVYLNSILTYNRVYRLTSAREPEDYVDIFLIRSAFLMKALRTYQCEITDGYDIGSGGGAPGIGLKILGWEGHIALVERSTRKCEFLRTVVTELHLQDEVTIINDDARNMTLLKNEWVTAQGVNILRKPLVRKITRWVARGVRIFWITHPVRRSIMERYHIPVHELVFPHPYLTLYLCATNK